MAFAVLAGVTIPFCLVGAILDLLLRRDGLAVAQWLCGALCGWWFLQGALLRAEGSRHTAEQDASPPWDEPALTQGRAWGYTWLAAACAVACSLAIGWQARGWVG